MVVAVMVILYLPGGDSTRPLSVKKAVEMVRLPSCESVLEKSRAEGASAQEAVAGSTEHET